MALPSARATLTNSVTYVFDRSSFPFQSQFIKNDPQPLGTSPRSRQCLLGESPGAGSASLEKPPEQAVPPWRIPRSRQCLLAEAPGAGSASLDEPPEQAVPPHPSQQSCLSPAHLGAPLLPEQNLSRLQKWEKMLKNTSWFGRNEIQRLSVLRYNLFLPPRPRKFGCKSPWKRARPFARLRFLCPCVSPSCREHAGTLTR